MYFKTKLIFIFCISFFLFPFICNAKKIVIDNVTYDVFNILEEEGFKYDPTQDTLTLTNANLKSIKTTENLKIILNGSNYLINEIETTDAIRGKQIEIEGDGSLEIVSKKNAIYAEKITINRTNLKVNSSGNSFVTTSANDYDLIINNSNLELETKKDIFNVTNANIYLNNSNIKVNKANYILSSFTKKLYLNNTTLNVLETLSIRFMQIPIYIDGNSYLKIKSLSNYFLNKDYILGSNLKILSSTDDLNYQDANPSSFDMYIKIYNQTDENFLKQKEEELSQKENLLTNKENTINLELEKINNLKQELAIEEENLNKKEIDLNLSLNELNTLKKELEEKDLELNNKENNLNLNFQKLNNLEKDLSEKKEKLNEYETNLLNELEKLNNEKLSLEKEKLEILNQKDNIKEDLIILNDFEKSLEIKEQEILKKEDELNALETTLDCSSESIGYIENPKTYDKFITSISILIVSIVGIITLLIIKKKGWLNG